MIYNSVVMSEPDDKMRLSRRTAIRSSAIAAGAATTGVAGLWFLSRGAEAALDPDSLSSAGFSVEGDTGSLDEFNLLEAPTEFRIAWEGFEGDPTVTFTLEGRTTGSQDGETGGDLVELFTTQHAVTGTSGQATIAASEFDITFNADGEWDIFANVDSLMLDTANLQPSDFEETEDGATRTREVEFQLIADVELDSNGDGMIDQTAQDIVSDTFLVDVGNLAPDGETGGTTDTDGTAS